MHKAGLTASPSILTSTVFSFCVDAHRDGQRFIVKADDLLTAFLSLERDAIGPKGANGNSKRLNVA
jgi:hypothetical protein